MEKKVNKFIEKLEEMKEQLIQMGLKMESKMQAIEDKAENHGREMTSNERSKYDNFEVGAQYLDDAVVHIDDVIADLENVFAEE